MAIKDMPFSELADIAEEALDSATDEENDTLDRISSLSLLRQMTAEMMDRLNRQLTEEIRNA